MSSHPSGTTINPDPEFLAPRDAGPPANSSPDASRHRVRTYTAHAFVLFNVYGLPLSSGIYLEYYFSSLHSSVSLLAISAIFSTQLACLSLAVGITIWLHRRWPKYWRLQLFIGMLLVCGAHLGLRISNDLGVLMLFQGALTGLGLGTLEAVSLRVLSTHYKHDITTTSTLCGSAGFFGAIAYTLSAWACLRIDSTRLAYGTTLLLLALTLLPAIPLAKPCTIQSPQSRQLDLDTSPTTPSSWRAYPVFLATFLTIPALLTPALYLPLLLTRQPGSYLADAGLYPLLALYGTALLSSALVPSISPNRLSPAVLCSAASILAGTAILPLVWVRRVDVAVVCAAVFGVGLGCVGTLWGKVFRECVEGAGTRGLRRWIQMLVLVGGLGAGAGLVGAAAVLERWGNGVEIVLGAVSGYLVLGGFIVGLNVLSDIDGRRDALCRK